MRLWSSLAPLALAAMASAGTAVADGLDALGQSFEATAFSIDLRERWEQVDQDGLTEEASAVTLRARIGFETGKAWGWALLADAEFLWPQQDDYNSTVNGKIWFPVVADPETHEINRLQLANTSLPDTTVILGRQRINQDQHRFVGDSGWRQNEQTFDALRVINKSIRGMTVDLGYLNQVDRSVGKDSPVGRYTGDSYLAHVSFDTPAGKLAGFAYVLELREAMTDSSTTIGARFSSERSIAAVKIAGQASFASQADHDGNPLDYRDHYYAAELTGTIQNWSGTAGIEILEGDGVKGFATPLATLHRFQGWADKLTATPANGIDDRYVSVGYSKKPLGILDSLSLLGTFHRFTSERLALDYGEEIDFLLQARWRRVTAALKYADYRAASFATDTRKLWIQFEYLH